jgi:photosystem II stability/assembly factor-like uncharacterized protein
MAMRRLGFIARTALLSIAGYALFSATWPVRPAPAGPRPGVPDDDAADEHDAFDRIEARARLFPTVGEQVMADWDRITRSEARRWADRLPGQGQGSLQLSKVGTVPGQSWINIGPTDATIEYNDNNYAAFDTGRPNGLLVDPRDPNVVYYGASAGGVWKSYDFVKAAPHPHWTSLSDGLTELSVGAMALDLRHPDTLYVGNGDPFDGFHGGTVMKSTDGGATWSAPVVLTASYPYGRVYRPTSIRDVKVDPNNPQHILVASRGGLFQSSDGGATYTFTDLPNDADFVAEAAWSLAYVGNDSWLVSGVTACTNHQTPPSAGYGSKPDPMNCPLGNPGDIWRSDDAGAHWKSLRRTAGALPAPPTGQDIGRITLATGSTDKPDATVVYAFIGNADERSNRTLGIWRSRDGGRTWKDATGVLLNPTLPSDSGSRQCGSMNIGRGQTWYNQAITVDPTNPDHVLAGGSLCSVRTLNGTADSPSWENVSHWLPAAGGTSGTAAGPLPYAHADWHTATVAVVGGKPWVLGGNDGGIYASTNVFDPAITPPDVTWVGRNRGIVTHLMYALGSGDSATGNGLVAIAGLQDNGTFYRSNSAIPTIFTGVLGGDGIGAAVNTGSAGEFHWTSVEYGRYFCVSPEADCTQGNYVNWWNLDPALGPSDNEPFFVYYAPILSDPTGVGFLTSTTNRVWKTDLPAMADPYDCSLTTGVCKMSWQPISPDFSQTLAPAGPSEVLRAVAARKIPSLYGAVLSGANVAYAVTSDGGATWTWSAPLPDDGSGHRLIDSSYLDFPNAPSAGKQPGDEYVVATSAPYLSDGLTPVPAALGHLFQTSDRGKTWQPISGDGGKSPLPNVPVYVVKYDPLDAQTLYAGTLIGVYVTRDGGATWERLGSGLPMVQVSDIYVAQNLDFIRISTYGRGMWEINPSDNALMGASGDGDYDRNLQLDWVDLAALASRLGTRPSTTSTPLYSYLCDLVSSVMTPGPQSGPAAVIDDADLQALLARFGGQP